MWLGEAGQSLIRAVDDEIPYLRKQSAQLQQQVTDLERRHVDLLKSAASAAREYKQVCTGQGLCSPCILSACRQDALGWLHGYLVGI